MIDDDRFQQEVRAALEDAPAPDSSCPTDAALAAFYANATSVDDADALREHLAGCPACVSRAREAQAFVEAMRVSPRRAIPGWALAAAAVLTGIALLVIWRSWPAPSPASTVETPLVATGESSARPWQDLEVEKAPYQAADGGGLLWRGGGEAETRPEEGTLAWAMEPYLVDDFATAAERLERRLRAQPDDDRALFYLGVSYLLEGKAKDALAPLRRVADASDDAAWYLALASLKAGDAASARPLLARIASRPGARAELAGKWLREIEGPKP